MQQSARAAHTLCPGQRQTRQVFYGQLPETELLVRQAH